MMGKRDASGGHVAPVEVMTRLTKGSQLWDLATSMLMT
jgi:hypothetical protein